MQCLRCGRECQNEQVFCADCLESMKAYPVKPGTAVQLPDRRLLVTEKRASPRRRTLSAEEQVLQLRKTVRTLIVTVAILSVVLGLTAGLLFHSLSNPASSLPGNLGRNYTTIDTDGK